MTESRYNELKSKVKAYERIITLRRILDSLDRDLSPTMFIGFEALNGLSAEALTRIKTVIRADLEEQIVQLHISTGE